MSNIPTNNIIAKQFNPIVTDISFNELQEYKTNNISIGINNSLIISIPQNNEGQDIPEESSIWVSDNDGMICPISYPISKLRDIITEIIRNQNNQN